MPGGGNCDPETESPFWDNETWHCQPESQDVFLGHFNKEPEFRATAIRCERYRVSHEFMTIWPWNYQPTFATGASDVTQGVEPSESMKETQITNPWKKMLKKRRKRWFSMSMLILRSRSRAVPNVIWKSTGQSPSELK
jgi:hypothetical protein